MGKKIVISFPSGRGSEIPLLYFSAKHYEDLGYEINNMFLHILTRSGEALKSMVK